MADRAAIANQVMEAFDRRDFEEVLRHLHPDYEATWPHGHLTGPAAVAHEAVILTAVPDLRMEVRRATETDDGALLELVARGTHTGAWTAPDGDVHPPTQGALSLPMAIVMVFDGDRIRSERLYFDQRALFDTLTTG